MNQPRVYDMQMGFIPAYDKIDQKLMSHADEFPVQYGPGEHRKTLYADAKKKRSKREAVFSNHKEKEFQKSLKLLESEAPAGFLRGQGALAASPSSTSDPSALFGLQPTSSTADSDLTYKSLPGSRMSALGGNAGPSTNQWI